MLRGSDERAEFSNRLISALEGLGWKRMSPKRLADEFNVRAGVRGVTTAAVRKWLVGEGIPTQERLTILASLLKVEPDQLRFGAYATINYEALIPTQDIILLRDLVRLDPANKKLVHGMIAVLMEANARTAGK